MLWPNSGVSCSTHQRRTNLFIPQRVEYSIESLVRFTFLWAEVTVLAVPLVNGSPNFLYPIHVCHFHRLFSTIIAVVYVMLTRRSTHVSILLGIVVARIHLTQALFSKKLLGIPPREQTCLTSLKMTNPTGILSSGRTTKKKLQSRDSVEGYQEVPSEAGPRWGVSELQQFWEGSIRV